MTRRRFLLSGLTSLSAVVLTAALCLIALATASGVTQVDTYDYDTEFIEPTWLMLTLLAAPLIGLAAFWSVRFAALGLVGMVVADAWAMTETVLRYGESGWSDGLEVLGYLHVVLLGGVALICLVIGGTIGHARRRRPGPAGPVTVAPAGTRLPPDGP